MKNNIDREKIKNFVYPFYCCPSRFFHNWDHILSAQSYFDIMSDEQYIAWMFHDIIYLPGSQNNEKNSADYLSTYININNLNIDNNIAYQIVLDTKEHISTIKESLFILDIDMLCLSFEYEDFYKSRMDVVKEYSSLFGYNETIHGTKDFLRKLLGQDIYFHENFKNRNTIVEKNILKYINS